MTLVIDLLALEHNYNWVRRKVGHGVAVWAVVKANAYGLGAVAVAQHLERLGVNGLCVATLDEAVELREGGIISPILVMGGIFPGDGPRVVQYEISPVVYSMKNLEETAAEARRTNRVFGIHFKVDTGMSRLGFQEHEVEPALARLRELGTLKVVGLMSHLAEADPEFSVHTNAQIARFEAISKQVEQLGFRPAFRHLAASSGVIASKGSMGLFNMVRPGIVMHGSVPNFDLKALVPTKPVATLCTEIMQIKHLGIGERVSYGGTFVTKRETVIGVTPIGYADGVPRLLSNTGHMLVRGRRVPIAGNVCMDMTMIDVTDVPGVSVGDEAVVFGAQQGGEIPLEEVAGQARTNAYAVLTRIGRRVRRIYVNGTPSIREYANGSPNHSSG